MPNPYKKNKGIGKQGKQSTPCKYYLRGKCSNAHCPYLHSKTANHSVLKKEDEKDKSLSTSVMSTMLKLFFEKQQTVIYNAENGMLNLNCLTQYSDLQSVATSINFQTQIFCQALCKCIALISPPPSAISMNENNITSFYHMAKAMEEENIHVTTRALSLAENKIADIHVAVELKKFSNLAEVDLSGNPVTQLEHYRKTFKKQLPWLLGLDRMELTVPPLTLPWPHFKDPVAVDPQNNPAAYDDTQKHILQFVQQSILNTLETEPGSGQPSGVDAVSDHYALNASLTFCLTCPEASVSTPSRTVGGGKGVTNNNDVVREIVAFRLRQTEDNHNLIHGNKAQKVAMGRTQVCARLERWLYPKQFVVGHFIHSSPNVVVLDNHGCGPDMVVGIKEPVSVVTLHGVMMWRFRNAGPSSNNSNKTAQVTDLKDAIVIKRNFARTLTISMTEAGRWHIVNDFVQLAPFSGREVEPDEKSLVGLTEENVFFRDIHEYNTLFSPAADVHRIARYARTFNVPPPVVHVICQNVQSDRDLTVILNDIAGLGMDIFEGCAGLVDGDPLRAVFVARLGNRFGVPPDKGAEIVRQVGLNWDAVVQMASGSAATN